jgi:hypothetical protein
MPKVNITELFIYFAGQFKEHLSGKVEFPDLDANTFETTLQWICKDYLWNGNNMERSQRVEFEFAISPEIVMDLLYQAQYLEVCPKNSFIISDRHPPQPMFLHVSQLHRLPSCS